MKLYIFSKIFVALATLVYIVVPFLAFIAFIFFASFVQSEPETRSSFMFYFQISAWALACFLFLLQVGLVVFYVIHIFKNKVITDSSRIIAVLGVIFMPIIGMPIYYILYVWRDQLPASPSVPN